MSSTVPIHSDCSIVPNAGRNSLEVLPIQSGSERLECLGPVRFQGCTASLVGRERVTSYGAMVAMGLWAV